jgi:hypothetical protein
MAAGEERGGGGEGSTPRRALADEQPRRAVLLAQNCGPPLPRWAQAGRPGCAAAGISTLTPPSIVLGARTTWMNPLPERLYRVPWLSRPFTALHAFHMIPTYLLKSLPGPEGAGRAAGCASCVVGCFQCWLPSGSRVRT